MSGRGIIKIARKGFDARYCHPRHRTVDSKYNQFKVHMQGGGTISISAGETLAKRYYAQIEHGLDYEPQIRFSLKDPSTSKWAIAPCRFTVNSSPVTYVYGTDVRGDGEYMVCIYNPDLPGTDTTPAYHVEYEYIIYTEPLEDVWT